MDIQPDQINLSALQHCIDLMLASGRFSDEHLNEIYKALTDAGLWGLISLGEYDPSEPADNPVAQPRQVVITPEYSVDIVPLYDDPLA